MLFNISDNDSGGQDEVSNKLRKYIEKNIFFSEITYESDNFELDFENENIFKYSQIRKGNKKMFGRF